MKQGKFFHLHAIQSYRERRCTAILILTISITWRSVVTFTFRLLYFWYRTLVPTEHEIVWFQSRFGRFEAEKSTSLVGIRTLAHPVRSVSLYRLRYSYLFLQSSTEAKCHEITTAERVVCV